MQDYYSQMQNTWEQFQRALDSTDPQLPLEQKFNIPGYHMDTRPNFAFLQLRPENNVAETPRQNWQNWKFHLSISPDDVPRAWNIVVDELVRDSPDHVAKVVKAEKISKFADPDHKQAGKMITIYGHGSNSPEEHQALLRRIEQKLKDSGIKPGVPVNGDRPVSGSQYASYRNDKTADGRYLPASVLEDMPAEQRYNPSNTHDPYARFTLADLYTPKLGTNTIREVEWNQVFTRDGTPAKYVDINSLWPQQREFLMAELRDNDIKYRIKDSSLSGGTKVIAVEGIDEAIKLTALQKGTPQPSTLAQAAETLSGVGKKSGLIGGAAFGLFASGMAAASGASAAEVAEIGVETAVPYAESGIDLARGDTAAAARSATVETAANIGGLAGAAGGAAAGAAIGSVVPILGTGVGAIVGGIVGGIGIGAGAGMTTDYLLDNGEQIANTAMDRLHSAGNTITSTREAASLRLTDAFERIAGGFNAAPESTVAALDAKQVRQVLQTLPEHKADDLSPETASLHAVRSCENRFNAQFSDLEKMDSLSFVAADMNVLQAAQAAMPEAPPPMLARAPQNRPLPATPGQKLS